MIRKTTVIDTEAIKNGITIAGKLLEAVTRVVTNLGIDKTKSISEVTISKTN